MAIGLQTTARAHETIAAENWEVNTAERMAVLAEVGALLNEYYYRIDHGQAENVADMFTENAILHIAFKDPLIGREAIRENYAKRSKTIITRHVSSNLRVIFLDANHVEALRIITYYSNPEPSHDGTLGPAIPAVVEYKALLERNENGKWRFASRVATPLFTFRD